VGARTGLGGAHARLDNALLGTAPVRRGRALFGTARVKRGRALFGTAPVGSIAPGTARCVGGAAALTLRSVRAVRSSPPAAPP